MRIAFWCLLIVTLGCSPKIIQLDSRDLRKAFEHHQKQENPEMKAYYGVAGGESFVMSERWKNYQKYAQGCPSIAEVTKVAVSKTSDGGDYVIQMSGPSAHEGEDGFVKDVCSLWINGSGENRELEVRDFTSY